MVRFEDRKDLHSIEVEDYGTLYSIKKDSLLPWKQAIIDYKEQTGEWPSAAMAVHLRPNKPK